MTSTTKATWNFKVSKKQRGSQGQWFAYRGRGFATEDEAIAYAEEFADQQVGVPGTRIVVTARKGGKVIRDIATA